VACIASVAFITRSRRSTVRGIRELFGLQARGSLGAIGGEEAVDDGRLGKEGNWRASVGRNQRCLFRTPGQRLVSQVIGVVDVVRARACAC